MRNRLYWKLLTGDIELSSRILTAGCPAFSYVSPLHPKVNLMLAIKSALIYHLDMSPSKICKWNELENIKLYAELSKTFQ